jgi:small multidrug resistance family-3 protein
MRSDDNPRMDFFKTFGLFVSTAVAEIVGCYLPYRWLKQEKSAWLLLSAAASLAAVRVASHAASDSSRPRLCRVRRRGDHLAVAGRQGHPSTSDWVGVAVCFLGMAIIMFGPRAQG